MENKYLKYKQKYLNSKSIGGKPIGPMYGPLDYPLEQEREDEARAADPVLHLIDLEKTKQYYENCL